MYTLNDIRGYVGVGPDFILETAESIKDKKAYYLTLNSEYFFMEIVIDEIMKKLGYKKTAKEWTR